MEKIVLSELRPSDTPEYMTPAWLGCVHYALGNPDIMEAFRRDTGNQWQPATDGLGKMIDKACNAEEAFLKAFILWVNVNVWGSLDGKALEDDGNVNG